MYAVTKSPRPNADEGSILVHTLDTDSYMMMLVYKNGAMTRKFVRDSVKPEDADWSHFNRCMAETSVGNDGRLAFYYNELEITPALASTGLVRYGPESDEPLLVNDHSTLDASDCRGIIESQALSYKHHARLLGLAEKPSQLIVTGGGSVNRAILQVIADVFEVEVRPSSVTNTAAFGAARRALFAYHKQHGLSDVVHETTEDTEASTSTASSLVVEPNSANFAVYRALLERYARLEQRTVQMLNNKH